MADVRKCPISEIVLVRSPGNGPGQKDRLVLKRDGTAEYQGIAKVERLGRFQGSIPIKELDRLSALIHEAGFFDLKRTYRGTQPGTDRPLPDAPGVLLTAICDGNAKTVADYGRGGPPALQRLHTAILDAAKTIVWRKDGANSN
ncbi:MAG: hypothetical protein K0Q72_2238 [Armatimonadetes bacterium]|jgi:hypothetical protein|nr:hypothetical protein [Armatimonadota bacterium]